MGAAQAKFAFQVISERHDYRRSTIVTITVCPFKDRPKVVPDPLNAQGVAEPPRAPRTLRFE
jgi:hypothetical protein